MTKFFARLLAFLLAVTFMAAAILVLIQLRPESTGGFVVLIILGVLAIFVPIALYRWMMTRWKRDHPEETRVGAGLAMGTGIDSARRRKDQDQDDLDLYD
ncbi:MAG: hypothetical protein ABL308_06315 [Oceanicaulis sp.]